MDYETEQMSRAKANDFEAWFDREIGTDRERNEGDEEDTFYFVCLELTKSESAKIAAWEIQHEEKI